MTEAVKTRPASGGLTAVALGASAGGLGAFSRFFDAMPPETGMAFILVQHLDPNHKSMMVDLLAKHSRMPVLQAEDGIEIEPDHVYIIPPAAYLSVDDGKLRLSKPTERHGARLPFDFLLHSMAEEFGERAICVVLSGTGADGSLGLKAVSEAGGLVIAQHPDDAEYDGMPRSAILTGAVDMTLPVSGIPETLVSYHRRIDRLRQMGQAAAASPDQDWLPEILDLLRTMTGHDFAPYKQGTLRRRIERRMAMVSVEPDSMGRYLEMLRDDPRELDLLANDLLINITSYFRDPDVFKTLEEEVIPDLVAKHPADRPLRIWVVGCSTGEETYSLAMLFLEQIKRAKRNIKLQIFASDASADVIATAREGLYPATIESEVSAARLDRFFIREEHGYRVVPELRSAVVLTVHDVLSDPPFARLDMVSCRNLLIYLQPQAQARVISLFHFALNEGGILLLGSSETAGNVDGRFGAISKTARIYRHLARSQPGALGFTMHPGEGVRPFDPRPRNTQHQAPRNRSVAAELCRKLVLEAHAPASILIDRSNESLYLLGPTDRYLRTVSGYPTHDVFAMAREDVRTKLRAAVHQARKNGERVVVTGGRTVVDGASHAFSIVARPVSTESDTTDAGSDEDSDLVLVSFIEEPEPDRKPGNPVSPEEASRVAELERELDETRSELTDAVRDLEDLTQAQKEINEEALSVNEEFQATNEELETSKEELQSLNEELTALNNQLHETLERERTIANDLQNVLYSTNVATLFLDANLNIRFFTPATKQLFSVIPGDIDRPITDLHSLAADRSLVEDAQAVLRSLTSVEKEVPAQDGAWYSRHIQPYRTDSGGAEGIVITFTDVTEQKHAAVALARAKEQAEAANLAKSRFLAAASHDLRQPLQTLALIQGVLARDVQGEKAQKLVARLGETTAAMSGMLNALLDLNQIEAGVVRAEKTDFPIGGMLNQIGEEFIYFAESKGLQLRIVPSSRMVYSDPRLLEQMIRNLLSNALKYTKRGKILVGCRLHGEMLKIEFRDTGIGIPDDQLEKIFEEYRQVDNTEHDGGRGIGLGLSIVKRFAGLLGHRLDARSQLGHGSAFTIEIPRSRKEFALSTRAAGQGADRGQHPRNAAMTETDADADRRRSAVILVVEDDPEVLEFLGMALAADRFHAVTAPDGAEALKRLDEMAVKPSLIVTDYSLPNGMNGLEFLARARERLNYRIPAVVLSGDISTASLKDFDEVDCTHLSKPVKTVELMQTVESLIPEHDQADRQGDAEDVDADSVVYVIDDESEVLQELRYVLEDDALSVETYPTANAFLDAYRPGRNACLLADAVLPDIGGIELLERLGHTDPHLTTIILTGKGDMAMAIDAMKAGASDFLEKPVGVDELVECVRNALARSRNASSRSAWHVDAAERLARLTPRQREIVDLILEGHPNKNIAADLGISQRTVESHRAAIMKKTGVKSLPALARLALIAADDPAGDDDPAAPPPADQWRPRSR